MGKPPAIIWKFFEAADENGQRKCQSCDDIENNSSNVEKHIKVHHPEEFKKFEAEKEKSPSRKRPAESLQSNDLKKMWTPKSAKE
jgi:hypothetical protein